MNETGSIIDIVTVHSPSELHMEWVIAAVAALCTGWAIHFALSEYFQRSAWRGKSSATESRFRNVFAMMNEDRRQSIIRYHMQKYECGREEAMRRAIDDRSRDSDRWS